MTGIAKVVIGTSCVTVAAVLTIQSLLSRSSASSAARGQKLIRKGFVMSVTPGREEEYERRHNPVRPEMLVMLRRHGVQNYSIWLHPETRQLFGYVEISDLAQFNEIPKTPECQEWWRFMADVMPHNEDNSPITSDLRRVFYMK